jgi:iron complex transport system substrate-binding protein
MKQWLVCAALVAEAGMACAQQRDLRTTQRVVTVGGGVTEIVYALGAGARVVAVDTTSIYPAAVAKLPNVGYMRTLSAEGVLSLRPERLLATSDAGPAPALAQIRSAGVQVTVLPNAHSFESLVANVRSAAAALGVTDDGERLAKRLQDDWSRTEAQVQAARAKPRVLFIFAHGGGGAMQVGGVETGADAMIRYAGATNVAAALKGYKPLTPEAVIAMAPDVVLITEEGMAAVGGPDRLWAQASLAQTPAGKAKRVVSIGAIQLLGFGPRMPEAVRDLAARLRRP